MTARSPGNRDAPSSRSSGDRTARGSRPTRTLRRCRSRRGGRPRAASSPAPPRSWDRAWPSARRRRPRTPRAPASRSVRTEAFWSSSDPSPWTPHPGPLTLDPSSWTPHRGPLTLPSPQRGEGGSLVHDRAAVDVQRLAGNVARLLGGQEDCGVADVLRRLLPLHRDDVAHPLVEHLPRGHALEGGVGVGDELGQLLPERG